MSNETDLFSTEQREWLKYFGSKLDSVNRRRQADLDFDRFFSEKHAQALKKYFWKIAKEEKYFHGRFKYLNDIHPKAWNIIFKYGCDYEPLPLTKYNLHKRRFQPEEGSCCLNSEEVMYFLRSQFGWANSLVFRR